MRSNTLQRYGLQRSLERIDEIINENERSFQEVDGIPARERLTFTNGFYVNCSAMFVDIRDSSKLPKKHTRPKLAKLYRAYLSEVVAIMDGEPLCQEINIIGDGVSGIFSSSEDRHADTVLDTVAKIMSLVKILNFKFRKNNIESIRIGIGISWGRALMVKAGFAGSGINDVVWMGDVVNEASKLASRAGKAAHVLIAAAWRERSYTGPEASVIASKGFYDKLSRDYQGRLDHYIGDTEYYYGIVEDSEMESWYERNCQQSSTRKLLYWPS